MTVEKEKGEKIVFGYARDISKGGIGVNAEIVDESNLPNIGDEFFVKFKLPNTDTVIAAKAEVVRMNLYDDRLPVLALQFKNLDIDFSVAIDRYVKDVLKL